MDSNSRHFSIIYNVINAAGKRECSSIIILQ